MLIMSGCFGCSNHDPVINEVKVNDNLVYSREQGIEKQGHLKPGQQATIKTIATDEDGDILYYKYNYSNGAIEGSGSIVTWTAPKQYVISPITITVNDDHEGIDSKTINIEVSNCPDPLELSAPVNIATYFIPSGWMGDGEQGDYVTIDVNFPDSPNNDPPSTKWSYKKGPVGWAAVAYQYPENNWGDCKGIDIKDAKLLSFYAKGDKGGEPIDFKIGSTGSPGKPYKDSLYVSKRVSLTNKWEKYQIDLSGKDTSCVISGFVWATNQPVTFYLDDILIEK